MAAPTFLQRVTAAWDALLTPRVDPAPTEARAAKKGMSDLQRLVAAETPRIDKSPVILGPSMNPANVSNALRRAERGYMRSLCDLLSEQRETVTHLQGELGKREDAISACDIVVTPANVTGRNAKSKAQKYADYIRFRIDGIEGLHDAIKHLSGATYFGRSGLEVEWMRDAQGLGIRALHPILPKRLSYAADWRIHLFDEAGNIGNMDLGQWPGIDIRETWPDKFVIHEPRTLGPEPPTRQGLGRVLVWAGMFWKWDAKHWLQFAELFANPWRIGYYEKGTDDNDVEALKQGLIQLSGMTTAVFAKGCEPKFLQATDSRTHKDLFETWCGEISKVVNGGTLATQLDGEGGSRAAAEVHEREASKLKVGDGRALDFTLTRDLWCPLIRRQFGAEEAAKYCPVVTLDTVPAENIQTRSQRIWAFIDRGGEADMDEVREITTGLNAPSEKAKRLVPLGTANKPAPAGTTKDASKPDAQPSGDAPANEDA